MFTSALDRASAAPLFASLLCLMNWEMHEVQVECGVGGITSGGGGPGICEWFMIYEDPELSTFKEMLGRWLEAHDQTCCNEFYSA